MNSFSTRDDNSLLLDTDITSTVDMVSTDSFKPYDKKPDHVKMWSPMSEVIRAKLKAVQPFPGDPSNEWIIRDRFYVMECNAGVDFVVLDRITLEDLELLQTLGRADSFHAATWYAIRCAQLTGTWVHTLEHWWFHNRVYCNHYAAAVWYLNGGQEYTDFLQMTDT